MLKLRQATIYTVLVCLILNLVSPMALSETVAPPPTHDDEVFDQATTKLAAQTHEFNIDPETEAKIEENVKDLSTTPDKLELASKVKRQSASIAQSFFTTMVLLAIKDLKKRAHNHNLQLAPDNVQKLSSEYADRWSLFWQAGYNTAGTVQAGTVFYAITHLVKKNSVMAQVLSDVKVMNLFKYVVSGALFTIGQDYISGFSNAAAELVMHHQTAFGASNEEVNAIKLIKSRGGGLDYFGAGLFESKETLMRDHKQLVLYNAHWKMLSAMWLIMFSDDMARERLFDHLISCAVLQGNSAIVIAMSTLSDLVNAGLISDNPSRWEKTWKSITIGIGMGVVGNLLPRQWPDYLTAKFNMAAATASRNWYINRLKLDLSITSHNPSARDQALDSMLYLEMKSREQRLMRYAYLMQLCLERTGALIDEKNILINDKTQNKENIPLQQGAMKNFDQAAYNALTHILSPNRTEKAEELAVATRELGSSFVGGDWGSYDAKLKSLDSQTGYYKNIFDQAATKMRTVYADDIKLIETLAPQFSASKQPDIQMEIRNLEQMQLYISHFTDVLNQKWTTPNPSVSFYPQRDLLEEISFWGISESDSIKTLNALSFLKQLKVTSNNVKP